MIEYHAAFKAGQTESALKTLLRYAGYSVSHIGINAIVPEVEQLDAATYHRLAFSDTLRTLPDFLIRPPRGSAIVADVKYTSCWSRPTINALLDDLRRQQHHHRQTHTILIRGIEGVDPASLRPDDCIRVLRPGRLELLAVADVLAQGTVPPMKDDAPSGRADEDSYVELVWRSLDPLPVVFDRINEHPYHMNRVVQIAQALARP